MEARSETLPIGKIHLNKGQVPNLPKNPRFIRDERFKALCKSIADAPEMLSLREILVYDNGGEYVIIGGNMRFRAVRELGFKEVPCKILPQDTPVDKLREYTIKDNVAFGENDWEALDNEWDGSELADWGEEVFVADEGNDGEKESERSKETHLSERKEITEDPEESEQAEDMIAKLLDDRIYPGDNEFEIPVLMKDRQPLNGLILPFNGWGAGSRDKKMIGTYHFYVDDYRFENIWKHPEKVVLSGCKAIVEPNLSLFDTTPIAYGLQQIYKKRWIARYFQECGIDVYADLNVSVKFKEYNKMGIPKGYNAFFTRGYDQRLESLKGELEVAQEISGLQTPNLIVYGGGSKVKKFCAENSLVYTEQFMIGRTI